MKRAILIVVIALASFGAGWASNRTGSLAWANLTKNVFAPAPPKYGEGTLMPAFRERIGCPTPTP